MLSFVLSVSKTGRFTDHAIFIEHLLLNLNSNILKIARRYIEIDMEFFIKAVAGNQYHIKTIIKSDRLFVEIRRRYVSSK